MRRDHFTVRLRDHDSNLVIDCLNPPSTQLRSLRTGQFARGSCTRKIRKCPLFWNRCPTLRAPPAEQMQPRRDGPNIQKAGQWRLERLEMRCCPPRRPSGTRNPLGPGADDTSQDASLVPEERKRRWVAAIELRGHNLQDQSRGGFHPTAAPDPEAAYYGPHLRNYISGARTRQGQRRDEIVRDDGTMCVLLTSWPLYDWHYCLPKREGQKHIDRFTRSGDA